MELVIRWVGGLNLVSEVSWWIKQGIGGLRMVLVG
jgi:hypothetical protein